MTPADIQTEVNRTGKPTLVRQQTKYGWDSWMVYPQSNIGRNEAEAAAWNPPFRFNGD